MNMPYRTGCVGTRTAPTLIPPTSAAASAMRYSRFFGRLNPSFLTTLNEDMERFAQVQSIADEYVRSVSAEIVRLDGNGLPVIDHQKLTAKRSGNMSFFRLLEPFGFTSSVVADLASVLKSDGTVSGRTFVADEYLAVTSSSGRLLYLQSQTYQSD